MNMNMHGNMRYFTIRMSRGDNHFDQHALEKKKLS